MERKYSSMKKLGSCHLNQVIKVNITSNWAYWHHVFRHMMRREGGIISVVSSHKVHNLSLNMRKHWTSSNWETFYKHLARTQQYQGHERQEKTKGLSHMGGDQRHVITNCSVTFRLRLWNSKKTLGEMGGKWIKSSLLSSILPMLLSWFQSSYHSRCKMLTLGE